MEEAAAIQPQRRQATRRVTWGRSLLLLPALWAASSSPCWLMLGVSWRLKAATEQRMSSAAMLRSSARTSLAAASSNVEIQDVNLFGEALKPCTQGDETVTGWTRSGSCSWEANDLGFHQVCVTMSKTFLQSSAKYDRNDLSSVVQDGGHWCICAWAWASAVSRDPKTFEGLRLDCERTNGHLRDVYSTFAAAGRGMASPSGAQYQAQAALEAVEEVCKA